MNKIKRINMLWLALCAVALTAVGQVPGSALDHMLQRPRVSKTYKDKTLFDHLFVDAGLGISAMGPGGITTNGLGELNIGDWFTPEHGMRLHFDGGIFKPDGLRTKYVGGGLDYLLNLTNALYGYRADRKPCRSMATTTSPAPLSSMASPDWVTTIHARRVSAPADSMSISVCAVRQPSLPLPIYI